MTKLFLTKLGLLHDGKDGKDVGVGGLLAPLPGLAVDIGGELVTVVSVCSPVTSSPLLKSVAKVARCPACLA